MDGTGVECLMEGIKMFGTNQIVGKRHFRDAPKDSLFVTSMFYTLQGEGPYAGMPALFIRLAKCNLDCSFCFVPSTKIVMSDGKKKRIDMIEIGDMVMSWGGDKFEPKRVTKLYTSTATQLVKVTSSGEPVWVTPEHPFLTSNRGWVNAEHLLEGDKLVHWSNSSYMTLFNPQFDPVNRGTMSLEAKSQASANLQSLWQDPEFREKVAEFINNGRIIKKVEFVNPDDGRSWARLYGSKDAKRVVHNFEVEDNHTYIANNCVVHNCDTFFDDGNWMTFNEIEGKMFETIRSYWTDKGQEVPEWAMTDPASLVDDKYPGIVLVMTGGEPLLQDNISEFMRQQLPNFKAVQVESNGILATEVPEGVTLVCSPKCAEKNGIATKYFAPSKTILDRADCLKFVMSADVDSPYHTIPGWAVAWKQSNPSKEIYCSPMNVYNSFPQKIKLLRAEKGTITMAERSTVDEVISFWEPGLLNLAANQANHEYVGAFCAEHGYRLNLQQHLYTSQA